AYPGGPTIDMRAEVGLLTSNVLITVPDGPVQHMLGTGEMFGARVVVSGNSTGRFSSVALHYCGQAGNTDRACIFFDRLAAVRPAPAANASGNATVESMALMANPSTLESSAMLYGMASNIRVGGPAASSVSIVNNVMLEAYDASSIDISTTGNTIRGNLVLGTIKDMSGKSGHDVLQPGTFDIGTSDNWIEDNVAAGSERYGFIYYGVPCNPDYATGSFRNNTAHASLAGMWLQAGEDAASSGCTALSNFTAYMNWDFGIISTRGLPTNLVMTNVNILDTKHSGITVLRLGGFTEKATLDWRGGLL
ncbi:Fibrocystin-L, partial [Tetrabaena socialis]